MISDPLYSCANPDDEKDGPFDKNLPEEYDCEVDTTPSDRLNPGRFTHVYQIAKDMQIEDAKRLVTLANDLLDEVYRDWWRGGEYDKLHNRKEAIIDLARIPRLCLLIYKVKVKRDPLVWSY